MAEIMAGLVKDLRTRTGAGMMDCKNALIEVNGDIDQAIDLLRKQGLSAANLKAGRVASDGLIGIAAGGYSAAVIEVNSETDFVARNDTFQSFVRAVAGIGLEKQGDIDAVKTANYPDSERTVEEELARNIATIGENINLRRVAALSVSKGCVSTYVHGALADGLGKIGVLVGLESDADPAALDVFGRKLAMHIAASRPESVTIDDLSPAIIERERTVLVAQARESGKPDNIIEKMIEGRLRKFYEEIVLLDQIYVIDNESKVSKAAEDAGKELGAPVKITGFARFALGEAAEVS